MKKRHVAIILFTLITIVGMSHFYTSYSDDLQNMPYYLSNVNYVLVNDNYDSIRVAIIDTSLNKEHEIFDGLSITETVINDMDYEDNHGTLVLSSIINTLDYMSCKDNLQYIDFRFYGLGNDDNISTGSLVDAVELAIEEQCNIINISMGTYQNSTELKAAIDRAINDEILVIAACGDNATSQFLYPASYSDVISVSCIDANNNPMRYNNKNKSIDICIPGENIETGIIENNNKVTFSGSSASTALFTALTIELKMINPEINPSSLMKLLSQSSIDCGIIGKDEEFGFGILDYKNMVYTSKYGFYFSF